MGIGGLTQFLKSNFKGASSKYQNIETDHLFIDVNNLLYKKSRVESKLDPKLSFLKLFSRELVRAMDGLLIKDSIFLSMDGPGPASKMNEQKVRRLKSEILDKVLYYLNNEKELNIEKLGIEDGFKNDFQIIKDEWLSNEFSQESSTFTPGTDMMGYIKSYLQYFVTAGFNRKGTISNLKKVFISGADRLGEGEWKIFEMINSSNINPNEKIVITSSDSDLIIFSILSKCENIFILNSDIKSMIDIKLLKKLIVKECGIDSKVDCLNYNEVTRQILVDFSNLWFLNRTDHLPKVANYSIDTAWKIYKQQIAPIYNQHTKKYELSRQPLYDEKQGQYNYSFLREIIKSATELVVDSNGQIQKLTTPGEADNGMATTIAESLIKTEIETLNVVKSKLSTAIIYFNQSSKVKGQLKLENNSGTKKMGEKLIHSVKLYRGDNKSGVVGSETDINRLAAKFLDSTNEFWVKNIPNIDEKYKYKLFNIFTSLKTTHEEKMKLEIAKLSEIAATLEPKTPAQIVDMYIYGLHWNFNYFNGKCKDFKFLFPYNSISGKLFTMTDNPLLVDQTTHKQIPSSSSKPYVPLLFATMLIDFPNKHLIPTCLHSIYQQHTNYYSLESKISKLESFNPNTFKLISTHFKKLSNANNNGLTKFQQSQLEFQPTLKFTFNRSSRHVKVYKEVLGVSANSNYTINNFNLVKQIDYNDFFGETYNDMESKVINPENLETLNDLENNFHLNHKFVRLPKETFQQIRLQKRLENPLPTPPPEEIAQPASFVRPIFLNSFDKQRFYSTTTPSLLVKRNYCINNNNNNMILLSLNIIKKLIK